MAQHDYNLINQSGANFRADLNNALSAIVSNNSGATEPATMFAYELWVDTNTSAMKIRNSGNDAWITLPWSITANNTVDINGGTVNGITSLSFSSGSTVTSILDEDNLASNSATALATQQSLKTYIDSQVTAQDLDFQANSGGVLSIDLDSETFTLNGGTGITTVGAENTVTFNIDSTVATLIGSQTLTNKTIDIDNNTLSNVEVDNLKSGVLDTDLTSVSGSDNTLASAKAIKTYVDAAITAEDLDISDGTNSGSIDLDSETLGLLGGTGVTSALSGNNITFSIGQSVGTSDNVEFANVTSNLTGQVSSIANHSTSDLSEGSNLYFTDARSFAAFDTRLATKNTGSLAEGSNLYYTEARWDARLAQKTTDNITEGSTNLFFTNERTDDRVAALIQNGTGLTWTYDDAAGTFTGVVSLSAFNTSQLSESGNLYYTDARSRAAISEGSTQLSYDSSTGVLTYTQGNTDTVSEGSSNLYYTDSRVVTKINSSVDKTFIDNLNVVAASTSGNSATATTLAATRTFSIAGDATAAAQNFNGSADVVLSLTIDDNAVALGTKTTGNYVATIAGTANQIAVSGSGSETASITVSLPTDVSVANDLTVGGNLTVNGDLTYLDTTNLKIEDNLFELNANLTGSPVNDSGMLIQRGSSDNAVFIWDESADKFTLGLTTADGSATGNITLASLGTLVANIEGAITGNVTGNVSGSALTVTQAAQTAITSLGSLTGLTTVTASIGGGSTNGVQISQGAIKIKNGGSQSYIDFYCESNNAHYVRIKAPAHYAFSGNKTLTLPATTGNLLSSGDTSIVTNDMLVGSIANSKLANTTVSFGGVSLALGAADATPAFNLSDATNYPTSSLSGTITNSQLAGSIENSKFVNSAITVSDGSNTSSVALGETITYAAGEGLDIVENAKTITYSAEIATSSNKGIASFTNEFSVSSGAVSLATSGVTAQSYGSATAIPVLVVDSKGRITAASTTSISTGFTLSDGTNSQTIAGGDTLTVAGTSNEVDVAVSATDTLTIGLPSDVTISNDLTIAGDLTVAGTTTQTGPVVTDNNFTGLSNNNSGNSIDFGFYGKYVESATTKYGGIFYDASTDNTFRIFTDTQTEPSTTVNTGATGYQAANLILGNLNATSITLNSTALTSTATELNLLDGSVANTVVNSKAVIYGSSGELAGALSTAAQPNITSLGTISALEIAGNLIVDTNTLKVDASSKRIGINQASPDVSLDLGSNTDAVHLPAGTTGQRPSSPAPGYFRYNTTTEGFEGYTDEWGAIAGGGGGASAMETNNFTGDGSATAFTLSSTVSSEDNLLAFIEGVYQNKADFVASGTTITFDTAPVNGRNIVVHHVKSAIGGSNVILNSFTGDGSDTTFTLSIAPVSENNTQVHLDGVYQNKSTYTVSGTVLTFSAAPAASVAIEVIMFTQTTINVVGDGTVTSAKLDTNIAIAGTLNVTTVGNLGTFSQDGQTNFFIGFNQGSADVGLGFGHSAGTGRAYYPCRDEGSGVSNAIDLGTSTYKYKDLHLAGIASIGNLKIGTDQGSDGQVLTSTGSGVAWEDASGGVAGIVSNANATAITIDSSENVTFSQNISSVNNLYVADDIGHAGDTDTYMSFENNYLGFYTGGVNTLAMNAGKVGIGTSSPQRSLQVGEYGTGNGEIAIASVDSGVGSILFGDSASGAALYDGYLQYNHSNRCMIVAAGAQDLMRFGAGAGTTLSGLVQVTNYGNVGIGRTPQYYGSNKYVDMMAGANGAMVLQLIGNNGSGGKLNLAAEVSKCSIITENNGPLAFGCNQTEYMRLDNTGEFLINRTDGFGTGGAAALFVTGRSDVGIYLTGSNSSGYTLMSFHNGGLNQIGSIKNSNNNATTYNTSSDYRLKENVDYTWDATTRLKQLKPARFNWISDDSNTLVDGFMAHEVSSIVPEATEGSKDATEAVTNVVLNAEGNVVKAGVTEAEWEAGKLEVLYTQAEYDNGDIGENSSIVGDVKTARRFDTDTTWEANHTKNVYQSIDHSKLVPLLVKTIQELEARITTLENA